MPEAVIRARYATEVASVTRPASNCKKLRGRHFIRSVNGKLPTNLGTFSEEARFGPVLKIVLKVRLLVLPRIREVYLPVTPSIQISSIFSHWVQC